MTGRVGSWAALRPTKIVRRSDVQARQNRSHNADHALAALVHPVMLQLSPRLRHKLMQLTCLNPRPTPSFAEAAENL